MSPEPSTPLVSVVMATYAGDDLDHLRAAVESIRNQTHRRFEFLIAVDGPVDEGRQSWLAALEARDDRVRVLTLPENRGPAAARNAAIRETGGAYIAVMDADDISEPDRIERQLTYLLENDLDVAGSFITYIDEAGEEIGKKDMGVDCAGVRRSAHFVNPVNNPTAFGKAEVFKNHPYDERFRKGEDYHLWARLISEGYRVGNVPEYLHRLRTGPNFMARRDHAFFNAEVRSRFILMKTLPLWMRPVAVVTAVAIPALRFLPSPLLRLIYRFRNALRAR